MIRFVSTFPPSQCGVGAYTYDLTRHLPADRWSVTPYRSPLSVGTESAGALTHELLLGGCIVQQERVLWFQHAFGIWGRHPEPFVTLVRQAAAMGARTVCTFHTIHFESVETSAGLTKQEENLLSLVLPLLDAITVFSDGAFAAVAHRFPEWKSKVVVLRHGVHQRSRLTSAVARERLVRYLNDRTSWGASQMRIGSSATAILSPETTVIGSVGFVSADKDPLAIYELAKRLRSRFPDRRIVALYIGKVQERADRKTSESLRLMRDLEAVHDGRDNVFIPEYLPDEMLPLAFQSLDYCIAWYHNGTQSGRVARAQGAGICVVGRRMEGIGETLDLAGLRSAVDMDDLETKTAELINSPGLRSTLCAESAKYARRFTFAAQARKHLIIEEALVGGRTLPRLDRRRPDVAFILPRLAVAAHQALEDYPADGIAFLNVGDDVGLGAPPEVCRRIPLRDGVPLLPADLRTAVEWVSTTIARRTVITFCRYGKGRSVSVVIGYLCSTGMSYDDALRLVLERRPGAAPLPGLRESIVGAFGSPARLQSG
jgi:glycosyltransferase involved in cell wall biosynthesis/protein-tyrosine phosphatase